MIRDVLRMGDPRLLERAREVAMPANDDLRALLDDMRDTMHAENGAGLAAPQIGFGLRVVIFGFDRNERYPDAEAVPYTELINPVWTPLADEMEEGWEGCLSVPGLRGVVPRYTRLRYRGFDPTGARITDTSIASSLLRLRAMWPFGASSTRRFMRWSGFTRALRATTGPRPIPYGHGSSNSLRFCNRSGPIPVGRG